MLRRLLALTVCLALAGPGCGAGSASVRDEDEDAWEGSWGSDDGTSGRKKPKKKDPQPAAAPAPAPAAAPRPAPAAKPAPLSDDWGIDLIADPPGRERAPVVAAPSTQQPAKDPRRQADRRRRHEKPDPAPEPVLPPVPLVPDPAAAAAPPAERAGAAPALEDPPLADPQGDWEVEPPPVPRPAVERLPPPAPGPAPDPGLAPPPPADSAQPAPAAPQTAASEPDLLVDLKGGLALERGLRLQPAAGLGLGWNMGKFLGWPGLYLRADVDTFVGKSPLGTEYVLIDPGLGFEGRFALGPVNLAVLLEFALSNMVVTKSSSTSSRDPDLGLGFRGGLQLGLPLTDFFSLQVGVDGRYMKDPLSGNFEFSAVFAAGVGFSF